MTSVLHMNSSQPNCRNIMISRYRTPVGSWNPHHLFEYRSHQHILFDSNLAKDANEHIPIGICYSSRKSEADRRRRAAVTPEGRKTAPGPQNGPRPLESPERRRDGGPHHGQPIRRAASAGSRGNDQSDPVRKYAPLEQV